MNDDYEESIKQLSKLYNAKRFSINLNEFKEEIQELYDNIIDICDDTADIISYDSFIKNSNNALLFIDVPKYLREEKRFDFNFEWYKKLFSVLSIYYGDWIRRFSKQCLENPSFNFRGLIMLFCLEF